MEQDSFSKISKILSQIDDLNSCRPAVLREIERLESLKMTAAYSLGAVTRLESAIAGISNDHLVVLKQSKLAAEAMNGIQSPITPLMNFSQTKIATVFDSIQSLAGMKGVLARVTSSFELTNALNSKSVLNAINSIGKTSTVLDSIRIYANDDRIAAIIKQSNLFQETPFGEERIKRLSELFEELERREIASFEDVFVEPAFADELNSTNTQVEAQILEVQSPSELTNREIACAIFALLLWFFMQWDVIKDRLVEFEARLPDIPELEEYRVAIRQLQSKPGEFRLVTGHYVNLRRTPGMKSEVIMQLPKNATVRILGKFDRTWVHVGYEHEDLFIEGYVSVKFLKKVR